MHGDSENELLVVLVTDPNVSNLVLSLCLAVCDICIAFRSVARS